MSLEELGKEVKYHAFTQIEVLVALREILDRVRYLQIHPIVEQLLLSEEVVLLEKEIQEKTGVSLCQYGEGGDLSF